MVCFKWHYSQSYRGNAEGNQLEIACVLHIVVVNLQITQN